MKQLFVLISFITLFYSCNNNKSKNETSSELNLNFKKYHVQDKDLEKNLVRIIDVLRHNKNEVNYSLLQNITDDRFVQRNYNSDFVKVHETYYKKKENGVEQYKTTLFKNNEEYSLKIIKPYFISYNSNDTLLLSEYEGGDWKVKQKCKYKGKSSIEFKGKQIDCIVYDIYKYREFTLPGKEFENVIISEAYYGENTGLIYSKVMSDKDTIIYKVIDIIGINEFEELKKQ